MTNIVIWNSRGVNGKKEEITKRVKEFDIFAITESKLDALNTYNISGYSTVRLDSVGSSGGIVVFIHNKIGFRIINTNLATNNCDILAISMDCIDLDLIIIYRRPYGVESKSFWSKICKLGKTRKNTIIAGDFNSHHTAWNCYNIDKNGDNLLQATHDSGFFCINRDTMSRINNPNERPSNIDLIFASSSVIGSIDYKQLEDTWDSDHFPLLLELDRGVKLYKKKSNKLSTKCTDWNVYTDTIKTMCEELKLKCANENRRIKYIDLTNIMYKAVNKASGRKEDYHQNKPTKKEINYNRNPVKWWDAECQEVINDRKLKLKAYRKNPTLSLHIEYKKSCAVARKMIKKKKRECFKDFCNSINRWTGLSYVWKTVKILKNSFSKVNWNKWQTIDRDVVVREEINKIAQPTVGFKNDSPLLFLYDSEEDPTNTLFTIEELNRAIDMIRRISAPGRDRIDYKMIKDTPMDFRLALLDIINEIWFSATIPQSWREYQVHFIDKIGKDKVRPIALSSCMGKIVERMINERLVWWAEKNKIIHNSQNGFRRGRSCAHNLAKITSDIRSTLYQDGYSLAAFLDVSSAYDNVIFHILIHKLNKLKCPSRIVNYLVSWLQDRPTQFIVNKDDDTIELMVRKGLPQGAILSPILYDLYTVEITKNLPENIKVVQFADDVALYVSGLDRDKNKKDLQEALRIVDKNLNNIGLQIEPKKTSLMEFNKSGYVDANMSLIHEGQLIQNSGEVRFLDILMDNQLKFDNHISYVRGKVEKANDVVRFVSQVSRGPEINTALMLYKNLVRSVTDYGCFIYAPATQASKLKLERGQYLGLRTAMGYRNSTPTNVIIAESKVTFLYNRAMFLAKNFCTKILKYGPVDLKDSIEELFSKELYYSYGRPWHELSVLARAWNSVKKHQRSIGPLEEIHPIWNMDFNVVTSKIKMDLEYGAQFCHLEKKNNVSVDVDTSTYNDQDISLIDGVLEKYNIQSRPLIVYTDGSRTEEGLSTGIGIVCDEEENGHYASLPKKCSIFTAEAFAIKTALDKLLISYDNKEYNYKNIIIFSDCQSVLKALNKNTLSIYHNRYILEARNLYWKLEKNHNINIIIIWIPSHRGFTGNELADYLAKQGTTEEENIYIEVPVQDLTPIYQEEEWNDTQDKITFQARFKGIHYFTNYYKRNRKKCWFKKINAERYFCTLINRLRANHYNLNASLARKNYIASAHCACGHDKEDIDHVIWTCPIYSTQRNRLRTEFITQEIDNCNTEPIASIIKREDWDKLYIIYKFICSVKRVI